MEQKEFKVKFPLGTKLALSISLLLAGIVGFLSYSAIHLVIRDKESYTYQLESMEAYVGGREFIDKAKSSLDNMRLYLSAYDPRRPFSPTDQAALQSNVNNQPDAEAYIYALVKKDTGDVKVLTTTINTTLTSTNFDPQNSTGMIAAWIKEALPKLTQAGFALKTIPISGKNNPDWAIALADKGLADFPDGMPVAIAFIQPGQIGRGRRAGDLWIVDDQNQVMYSSGAGAQIPPEMIESHPLLTNSRGLPVETGTKEFTFQGKSYLGAFQKTPLGATVITQLDWNTAMAAAFTLGQSLAFFGLVSIVGALIFVILFSRRITEPLRMLYEATKQIGAGRFDVDPKVKTTDEVGALSNAVVLMSRKIQALFMETIKSAKMEEEIKVAAAVQDSLFPPAEYQDDAVEIVSHYQSATQCGGDWWGFFRVQNKIVIFIADATGHGIPSALITATARSCVSVMHKLALENPTFRYSPAEMMSFANKSVYDAAAEKIMMTFFIGVLDLEQKTITFANAGHNPPWLFAQEGEGHTLKSLVANGTRLGEVENTTDFEEASVSMNPGDTLFLYTDGLLENKDVAGTMYGKKRARKLVESLVSRGPSALIAAVKKDVEKHSKGKALDDDVTLAALRILEER